MDRPGALVQMDSKHVALGNGKVVYQFGAVDYFTRKRVVALAPRLTSHNGAEFLRQVVTQFPFQVQAIQSDGGSEFLEEFGSRSRLLGHRLGVTAHPHVVDQVVLHGPDHEFLLRLDSQLVLYAVEGVPDGHGAFASGLGDLVVGPAAGE